MNKRPKNVGTIRWGVAMAERETNRDEIVSV
jgi:hypothetical protein